MGDLEKIGRSEERLLVVRDICGLNDLEDLDELASEIREALLEAGYLERVYDEWATAYFDPQKPELRREPILINKWRNAAMNPNIAAESIPLTGTLERLEGGEAFVKFDEVTAQRMREAVVPGNIRGFSLVVRERGDARERVNEVMREFFSDIDDLTQLEDAFQGSKDPGVKMHSFGVVIPDKLEDDVDFKAAA